MVVKEEIFHLGVKAVILDENGNILLLKKFSKRNEYQTWDLPGGRIQKGEEPEAALIREVFEETGLQNLVSIDFVAMELTEFRIPNPLEEIRLIFSIYQCGLTGNKSVVLSNEHCGFQWVDPIVAATLLKNNYPERVTNILLKINDHKHLSLGNSTCITKI